MGSIYQASPSNPIGTTSTNGVMMGLAGSITSTTSGIVLIVVSCDITNSIATDGLEIGGRYGTGAAPINGGSSPASAQVFGVLKRDIQRVQSASNSIHFSVQGIVSLTVGVAYWIDLFLATITGGTASISNVNITAIEL